MADLPNPQVKEFLDEKESLDNDQERRANLHPDRAKFRLAKRKRTVQSPSRRRPDRSWRSNVADCIERIMEKDGHTTWGYVIYRTTYKSDEDWDEFLRMLRKSMEKTFDRCVGRDILDLFTLTIFSDPSLFDGLTTKEVRAHFRKWGDDAFLDEQHPADVRLEGSDLDWHVVPRIMLTPRYTFCIQVDEESLNSVVHETKADPNNLSRGWVKLIRRTLRPYEELRRPPRRPIDRTRYEPIEGNDEYDVGWMKVVYWLAMTTHYAEDAGVNGWRTAYSRPPAVSDP